MPLDAVCIHALAAELQERIAEGRIDKVQQPERDLLLLSLRAKGENLRLLLAAGTGNARVHVTRASFENPGGAAHVLHAAAQAPGGRAHPRRDVSRTGSGC